MDAPESHHSFLLTRESPQVFLRVLLHETTVRINVDLFAVSFAFRSGPLTGDFSVSLTSQRLGSTSLTHRCHEESASTPSQCLGSTEYSSTPSECLESTPTLPRRCVDPPPSLPSQFHPSLVRRRCLAPSSLLSRCCIAIWLFSHGSLPCVLLRRSGDLVVSQ